MKIFSDRRLPKCYSRAEWEPLGGTKAPPVLKLSFDLINQSDDPVEIVRFDVSHPSGVTFVADITELALHIYEDGKRPALISHALINEELDGKETPAQNPADRCSAPGRREYTLYCLPENAQSPVFEMTRKKLFERNIVVLTLSYRHADEGGRVRTTQLGVTVPEWKQRSAA
ncbi:hypothetical protein [Neokomagataea anthophila]|uniref:Uncharacterized protein n=1 Tax=Neokomagataea anthophila TaxID=2826925 RepID=A0ABS5E837_9PROT|nr:hypothetical protein [Neokomagataea anthophila]MBR0560044.1 hypothetical protein [Neokomagataea anthophila]